MVVLLQIFLQGTASLVNTTATPTQTSTLLEQSFDAAEVSSHEMSAVFDSPTQNQDVQTPTPSLSSSPVGSVDHLNGGMEVHSPATPSFSDISPISPLSTPSTPDHHTQHDPEGDSRFEDDSATDQGDQSHFFKLVGDNLDKNIKPRDMRSDHQTESLHFFNTLAVRDRVNLAHHSSSTVLVDPDAVNLQQFLPSPQDYDTMSCNMATLVSRVLVKHMPALRGYAAAVNNHIQHPYSKEMSQKSTVVCDN